MKNFLKKGFTALEFIIVLALVFILVSVVTVSFSKSRESQFLKTAVADSLSAIDKARGETLSSLNSSEYGVHFQSDKVIIFKGKVFSSGDSSNETISITSPVSISNVTLGGVSGTSGEFYFNRLSGAPSASGSVTMTTTNFSKIITISATGIASVN